MCLSKMTQLASWALRTYQCRISRVLPNIVRTAVLATDFSGYADIDEHTHRQAQISGHRSLSPVRYRKLLSKGPDSTRASKTGLEGR
jgi:hypothetical protein